MAIRRIAVEEAFVTPEIMAQWHVVLSGRDVEPGFAKMGETILAETPANKPLDNRLLDIGAGRIAHMDAIGVDVHVLSLTSPGVQVFDAPLATRLAAEANDALAAAVKAHPTRFAGLAAIAPQDPEAAAREIDRAAQKLGLSGLIINSHTMGEYLDAPKYRPIFEAAQAQDMPIYLRRDRASRHAPDHVGTVRSLSQAQDRARPHGRGIPFWLQRIDNRYLLEVKIGHRQASQAAEPVLSRQFRHHHGRRHVDAGVAPLPRRARRRAHPVRCRLPL